MSTMMSREWQGDEGGWKRLTATLLGVQINPCLLAKKRAKSVKPSSPVEFKSLNVHVIRSAPSNIPQVG